MRILGAERMSEEALRRELEAGGRLVVFEYCISLLVITYQRTSDVYFVPAGGGTLGKSFGYTLLTLLAGWWGFPWGPIYTVRALTTNFGGGRDVTAKGKVAMNRSRRRSRAP
jgi:hypothetical protein